MKKKLFLFLFCLFGLLSYSFSQEICDNGSDDDGDGLIDSLDPDCASFYGLEFIGDASDCSVDPPAGSTDFYAISDSPAVSGQNTVDTQSKMAIGDVDGDGIPDVVATSKWNKTIRVIATTDDQDDGSDAGDIKSSWGPNDISGNGYWEDDEGNSLSNSKHTFELEVAIADIDGDGTAEIFSIMSTRNTPNDPPQEFYLMGFSYAANELVPIFNKPVYLNDYHPGIFGIADFDGDGRAEIYLKNRIYAAESGVLLADPGGNWLTEVNSAPVAVDIIKGNANLELVSGRYIYQVPSLISRTLQPLTILKDLNVDAVGPDYFVKEMYDVSEYGDNNFSSTSVADFDEDGNIDVLLSGATGSSDAGVTAVFYWNVNDNTVVAYEPADDTSADGWPWGTGRINMGDVNGDGDLNAVFVSGNKLWSLSRDGGGNLTPTWPEKTLNDSKSGVVAVTIYDFNNDGKPEIVYRDSQYLTLLDGTDGSTVHWAAPCQSHTMTEGPIVADMNGDGATDICVPCNTNNSFDITAPIQQQALGEIRVFFSSENAWLPTRKVWNQSGYFVVNINDDLTLPFPQLDQNMVFGTDPCSNGIVGPNQPLNVFLNQVPTFGPSGCPVYPAPDLGFVGNDPNLLPTDPGYVDPLDPSYFPAVEVIPPICGDLEIEARFNIINEGALTITDDVIVSFFDGDPTEDPVPATPATLLHQVTLPLTGFAVGDTLVFSGIKFLSSGKAFTLYVVLNDDGSTLPVVIGGDITECVLTNNIYEFSIVPQPFEVAIDIIQDNIKCDNAAPDNGELLAIVTEGGAPAVDIGKYGFQWYSGIGVTGPVVANALGGDTERIAGVPEGDYTVIVTNLDKSCQSLPIDTVIVRIGADPEIIITETVVNSQCSPGNGILDATITGGSAGYTFKWFAGNDIINPIGIGPTSPPLGAGNYSVSAEKDGCLDFEPYSVGGPPVPVAVPSATSVNDCADPSSGTLDTEVFISGVLQPTTDFDYIWYNFDFVGGVLGSQIPGIHGTGNARTGLPSGWYAVVATSKSTACVTAFEIIEVVDNRVLPEITLSEVLGQTSCDVANPNGSVRVDITIGGIAQDPSLFTIEWFKGDNTLAPSLTNVSGTNGEIANGIGAGGIPYTARVTTALNCFATDTISISETLIYPVVTMAVVNNSVCDPALAATNYLGQVTASITYDGLPVADFTGYTIKWYDGDDPLTDPLLPETTNVLSNLDAGRYSIVVTKDFSTCASTPVFGEVLDLIVLPVIDITEVPETTCTGSPNGALEALVGGVSAGYTFTWYTGLDTSDPTKIIGTTSGTDNQIANQINGGADYSVVVVNNTNGCKNQESFALTDVSKPPLVTLTSTNNGVCDPAIGYTGTVSATVTDANGSLDFINDYTFAWTDSNGDPVIDPNAATPLILEGLNGDDYTLIVTNDVLGCPSIPEIETVVNAPAAINIVITQNIASTTCSGTPNGVLEAKVDNGGGPVDAGFTFTWFEGTDVSGTGTPTATDGNDYYAIELQGGIGQQFTVLVEDDATGCTETFTTSVADLKQIPIVALTKVDNTICDPLIGYNGFVTATVTDVNGTLDFANDYTFAWTNSLGNPVIDGDPLTPLVLDGVNVETYTLIVTNDILGCASAPVSVGVIDNPAAIVIVITENTPSTTCSGTANGVLASAVDIGGFDVTAGYDFEWFVGTDVSGTGTNTNTDGNDYRAIELLGGAGKQYTVKVTEIATGCVNTLTSTLADASQIPIASLVPTDNTVCDPLIGYTGVVTATVTDVNGSLDFVNDYTFAWTNSLGNPVADADPLTPLTLDGVNADTYSLVVTNDVLGCSSTVASAIVKDIPPLITIVLTQNTPSTTCSGTPNGELEAMVDNGGGPITAGYTFTWFEGTDVSGTGTQTNTDGNDHHAIELQGGIGQQFTVLVEDDASGCTETLTILLADDKQLPIVSLTKIDNAVCDVLIGYDGSVTATVVDVNGSLDFANDYTFTWTNSLGNPVADADPLTPLVLDGVDAESYTLVLTNDVLGCSSVPVTLAVTNKPAITTIGATNVPSTNCVADTNPNGQITADPWVDLDGDGTRDAVIEDDPSLFTYKWHLGTDTSSPIAGETAITILSIQGGVGRNYTVEAKHIATGCAQTFTVLLNDASELPIVTLATTENVGCDTGLYTGTVTATIMHKGVDVSASPDYTFAWTGPNSFSSTNAVSISNVENGDYTLTVTNIVLGCISLPVTETVADNPAIITIADSNTPSTNCIPDTDPNGQIVADTWVDLDGDGLRNVGIEDLPGLFSYQWHTGIDTSAPIGGATSATLSLVQGGVGRNYTVEVEHINTGCTLTYTVLLNDASELPVVTLVPADNTVCDDTTVGVDYDGTVTATVTYKGVDVTASGDYSFAWTSSDVSFVTSNASTISTLKGSETYTLTATNTTLSCIALPVTTTVDDNFAPIAVFFTNTKNTSCAVTGNGSILAGIDLNSSGSLDANEDVLANLTDYNFTWHVGNTTTGVLPGSIPAANNIDVLDGNLFYTLEVERISTGCITTYTEWVQKVITTPIISVVATSYTSCTTDVIVQALITNLADFAPLNNATTDFTYTWYTGSTAIPANELLTPGVNVNAAGQTLTALDVAQTIELPAGDYTVVVTHSNSSCIAPEQASRVVEPAALFDIVPSLNASATSCGDKSGIVFVNIAFNGSYALAPPYTYVWHEGVPTNTTPGRYFEYIGGAYVPTDNVTSASFYTSPEVTFSGTDPLEVDPIDDIGGTENPNAVLSGVTDGLYTVVVTDANGCREYITLQVPFAQAQQSNLITITPDTDCNADNSSIMVEVVPDVADPVNPAVTHYIIYLYAGANPTLPAPTTSPTVGDYLESQAALAGGNTFPAVAGTLAPGIYSIVSQGVNDPTTNCFSVPTVITIEEWAHDPIVNLVDINPNTSCDLPATPDGDLTIEIKHNADEGFGPGPPIIIEPTYSVSVLPADASILINGLAQPLGGVTDGSNVNITGLAPKDYTITVTSSRGCLTVKTYTVPDEPVIAEVFTTAIANTTTCAVLNGSMQVTAITQVGTGGAFNTDDFQFDWTFDANGDGVFNDGFPIYSEVGNGAGNGTLYDNTDIGFAGPGIYWVEISALPAAGIGLGCPSAPYQFEILDQSVNPTYVYDVTANTACDINFADASFYIDPDRNSPDAAAPAWTSWSLVFTSVPADYDVSGGAIVTPASLTVPVATAGEAGVFTAAGILPGQYDFTLTDDATGCPVTGSLVVPDNLLPPVLDNIGFTVVDQFICNTDGSITISQIETVVSGTPGPPAVDPTSNVDVNMANYSFKWYTSSVIPANEIVGVTDNVLDNTDGAGFLGAGIYWVEITKVAANAGEGGVGCTSAPYQFEILDKSVNPTFVYDVTANTACDIDFADASFYIDPDRNGPDAAAPAWTSWSLVFTSVPADYDVSGGAIVTPASLTAPVATAGEAGVFIASGILPGQYDFTLIDAATGCPVTGSLVVPDNLLPPVLDNIGFAIVDQFICSADGSITISQIETVVSGTPGPPAVDPTTNVDVNMANYTFKWYTSSVAPANEILGVTDNVLDITDGAGFLGAGIYWVEITKVAANAGEGGVGCTSAPYQFEIIDQSVNPSFTYTVTSNTACADTDPASVDGSITIVGDHNGVVPILQMNDWTVSWINTPYDPAPRPAMLNTRSNVTETQAYTDLLPGDYEIQLDYNNTGCFVTGFINIPSNPINPEIQDADVDIENQDVCTNDGLIRINAMSLNGAPDNVEDYDFVWYTGQDYDAAVLDITQPIHLGQGGAGFANGHLLDISTYAAIQAGVYWVVATKRTGNPTELGNGCPTPAVRFEILDVIVEPSVDYTVTSNTACADADELSVNGAIRVTPNDNGGLSTSWTYTWPTSPYAILPAELAPRTSAGAFQDYDFLLPGDYTVRVLSNAIGCYEDQNINVPSNPITPDVLTSDVDIEPQDQCFNDGLIRVNFVDLNGFSDNVEDYNFAWYAGTDYDIAVADITQPIHQGRGGAAFANGHLLSTATYAGIQAGVYWVEATKRTGNPLEAGNGCTSPPLRVEIEEDIVLPTFTYSISSNTACAETDQASVDGAITLVGDDNGVKAVLQSNNWTMSWISTPYDPAPRPATLNTRTNVTETQAYTGLLPGNYEVQLDYNNTACSITSIINIPSNPIYPDILESDVTVNPQDICDFSGGILVSTIRLNGGTDNVNNYDFKWYLGPDYDAAVADITQPIFQGQGGAAFANGHILDLTTYPTIQAGTYWVEAFKRTGNNLVVGNGCTTPPMKFVIDDASVDPEVAFTTTSNTACDLTQANGRLRAVATTSGVQVPLGSTFTWYSGLGTGTLFVGIVDNSISGESSIIDVLPGVYTVVVQDVNTLCSYETSYEVQDLPAIPSFSLDNATTTPQDICLPSGSIVISDSDVSPGTVSEYLFTWYLNDPVSTPLDSVPGMLVQGPVLDITSYPSIGSGTYYVAATRKSGVGAGCTVPPIPVVVDNTSTNPEITYSQVVSNSSCDGLAPNGTIVVTIQESDGTNTDPYSYTWTLDGAALPPVVAQTDAGNTSTLVFAPDGEYVVTVFNPNTGCSSDLSTTVNIDLTVSEPNIIAVTKIDPIDCNPSASIEVTAIEVGGLPSIVADHEYDWYLDEILPANRILDAFSNPVITPLLVGLVPGTYFVVARNNATQCESFPKEIVILPDLIVYPVLSITQPSPQTSCDGTMPNGSLSATADGQDETSGVYSFNWYQGITGTGSFVATGSTVTGLAAGEYSVVVQNNLTMCTITDYYIVDDGVENARPVVIGSAEPQYSCLTDDGSLAAIVLNDNGVSAYQFDWFNLDGTSYGSGATIAGVTNGSYIIIVTDPVSTCVSEPDTVVVQDERNPPAISVVLDNPLTNCYVTQPNGQLSATVGGKVGGYTFEWFTGASASGTASTRPTHTGLAAGVYTLRVTDNITGCFEVQTFEVPDNTVAPSSPTPEVIQHMDNCVLPNGIVEATVNGATLGYIFDWWIGNTNSGTSDFTGSRYQDLDIGIYTVTATDVITGCVSAPVQVEVLDQRVIPEFDFVIKSSECEQNNGSIELQPVNNVSIAKVVWTDQLTGEMFNGPGIYDRPPGSYDVLVTSQQGCEETGSVEIPIDIFNFNGISANGDGQNDFFEIACISMFPDNNVQIFNRAGTLVYEIDNYNNDDRVFEGIGVSGTYLLGQNLPDGTYFYIIDKGDGTRPVTGYLELFR